MTTFSLPVELEQLTWQEAEAVLASGPIGLLPLGAIEAHGPHLPLDTDVLIAREMARRAATMFRQRGTPAIVLPAIVFGVSFVGTCFPGTSPADEDAFASYLSSVLRNLAPQGYQVMALCNAHLEPAHVAAVKRAAQAVGSETGVPMVFPDKRDPRWAARLSEEFRRGSRHAGSYETSLILSAFPDRVRSATASNLPPVWIDLPARLRAGARTFAEAGSPLGYFGDPASASRAEGERLWEGLTSMIYDAVMEVLAVRQNPADGADA